MILAALGLVINGILYQTFLASVIRIVPSVEFCLQLLDGLPGLGVRPLGAGWGIISQCRWTAH